MTEQEAKALAERLRPLAFDDRFPPPNPQDEITPESAEALLVRIARIWLPKGSRGEGVNCRHSQSNFFFDAPLRVDVLLNFTRAPGLGGLEDSIYLSTGRDVVLDYSLWGNRDHTIRYPTNRAPEIYARLKPLCDEWLPVFRRGCWLSGCDIEASAHEKAEWMQSLTKEDLDMWKLTF